ncbi:MAG: tetraacyldisaccharide 4'-kinase [Kiritimatiellae bacterium]|nr:tetraacyldisaccharide 4'-kinase [Kiritimatiellia bacterium]MDD5522339.1 tetraacyldisaccharide 4'-kinase [Kiritimatiellia bacterium]
MHANKFEKIEKYITTLIQSPDDYKGTRGTMLFLWILRQFSRVYRAVIQFRHLLYANGIFRHHTLGCQVISVGNLTVGGTGKTPVVEIFARELEKAGRKVAILSRGYKKEEPSFWIKILDKLLLREFSQPPRVVSDGSKLLLDSAMSGDEPYMLASNLPNVCVLVDKNRVKSGRYAINKLGCDTLILDDGFQYLSLKHRVEIVLVDKTNPFGNEKVLPRGILREPVKNIKRADFIFITKSNGQGTEALRDRLRQLNKRADIIECQHCARHLQNVFTAERKPLEYLDGLTISVVSGIAVPGGFEDELEKRGAKIIARNRFADHHRYSEQEIIDIVNKSKKLKADAILTTEKDAVRFPRLSRCDVPVYFLRVDIEILSGSEDFHQCISRICFK